MLARKSKVKTGWAMTLKSQTVAFLALMPEQGMHNTKYI